MVPFDEKQTFYEIADLLIHIKLMTPVSMALCKYPYMNMSVANFCFKTFLRWYTDKINARLYECHYFQHSLILEEKETSFPHLPQPEESFLFENKITICFKLSLQL